VPVDHSGRIGHTFDRRQCYDQSGEYSGFELHEAPPENYGIV